MLEHLGIVLCLFDGRQRVGSRTAWHAVQFDGAVVEMKSSETSHCRHADAETLAYQFGRLLSGRDDGFTLRMVPEHLRDVGRTDDEQVFVGSRILVRMTAVAAS